MFIELRMKDEVEHKHCFIVFFFIFYSSSQNIIFFKEYRNSVIICSFSCVCVYVCFPGDQTLAEAV